jgi:putative thioredoxin
METMLKGAAPQDAPADLIKDSDQTKFAKDVLEASRTVPVIVDFWAPWCGPCKTLQPMIEKVVKEAKGAVKLVKIDIDKNQMLAQQLRIQSIPAVYAFFGGRPVDGFMGAVPESQIKQFVDRLIQAAGGAPGAEGPADEIPELLEHAKAAVAQNDWDLAARVYSEILGLEPAHVAALAGMARYHVQAGDLEQAKELLGQVPAKDKTNADVVAAQASIDLAEKAKEAGPVDDLKAKAAADPKDMQARLDLAMAYWANNQRQEAIDELLAMIKADRKWNEEAARQQLLKFFEALGFVDPLAVDGRKRLSTVLFS